MTLENSTTCIAMRKNGTLSYLLTDHLGSTTAVTNTSGQLVSGQLYKAWGESRYAFGSLPTTYKYTGQREESSFGLYFYNARWYDPVSGRFTSADTVVTGANHNGAQTLTDVANTMFAPLTVSYAEQTLLMKQNVDTAFIQGHGGSLVNLKEEDKKKAKIVGVALDTQAFDRYSYVRNSPLRYTDPTGHNLEIPVFYFDWFLTLIGSDLIDPLEKHVFKTAAAWAVAGAFVGGIAAVAICGTGAIICAGLTAGGGAFIGAVGGFYLGGGKDLQEFKTFVSLASTV